MQNGRTSSSRSLVKEGFKTHELGNTEDFGRKVGKAERQQKRTRTGTFDSRVDGTTKGMTILGVHVVEQVLVEETVAVEEALKHLALGMVGP